ncbi:MAG: methenyltetrahydromethanopterin cyclohydrolase, partial [Planctomycetia bacterium]|nr:methenyltetrahydromethanopterin cyclohydrolase [Planctomycetia bacterium]
MTLNERANIVADAIERNAAQLRVSVSKVAGARVIDCGGAVTGSLAAGLLMAR